MRNNYIRDLSQFLPKQSMHVIFFKLLSLDWEKIIDMTKTPVEISKETFSAATLEISPMQ